MKFMNQEQKVPTIAIVGRPNVGKSSLFNAIVGRRVSIVHEMPGVTRDRVVAPLLRNDRRFQLIDTGGLGMFSGETRKVDMWDSRIASQVEIAIEEADVLVLVVNVQEGVVSLDEEVARRIRESGKQVLLAVNKCDNPRLVEEAVEFSSFGFPELFPVSCLHRNGVNALLEAAIGKLPANAAESPEAEEEKVKKINIAVVGRPNVGKSSLVNALLGEERVMVSDVAGTTRDAIDVDFEVRFRGEMHPATLVDTAGLRKTAKVDTVVEYFSVMRAKAAIERADLVLFVLEADPDGVTAQDKKIAGMIADSGKGCVVVGNKFDVYKTIKPKVMETELRHSMPGMNYAPLVFVSARDKWNLDALLDRIAEVMEQLNLKITTGMLNRVVADAFNSHTPPVVAQAPLKIFYATMAGMTPPKVVLFVNNPKCCADNYLAFLKNTLRNAFDLNGLPIEIELRARPKKVESFRSEGERRPRKPKTAEEAARKKQNAAKKRGRK